MRTMEIIKMDITKAQKRYQQALSVDINTEGAPKIRRGLIAAEAELIAELRAARES